MNLIRHSYSVGRVLKHGGRLRFSSTTTFDTKPQSEETSDTEPQLIKKKKRGRQPSPVLSEMKEFASKSDDKDVKYLNDTFIKRLHQLKTKGDHDIHKEAPMSLWDYLMTYQDHYFEKAILIDRATASKIATAIVNNTDAKSDDISSDESLDSKTIFVDANGGLCRVTDSVINQCNNTHQIFSSYKIFEKDVNLIPVLQRARNDYLKVYPKDNPDNVISLMNFNKMASDWTESTLKAEYISDFYDRVLANLTHKQWNLNKPIYTLFMTPTHGTIKYFTMACLYRHESSSSEMSKGRPEFFYVVSAKTWMHLSLGTAFGNETIHKRSIFHKNILFNLLFDYELLEVLPRRSFIPWGKKKHSTEDKRQHMWRDLIDQREDNLYLIKARPKAHLGLADCSSIVDHGQDKMAYPPAHWLEYFVHAICLHRSENRFLPLLDKWHPSAALHCVRKGIVPVYMQFNDFFTSKHLEKIIPIFNSLLQQQNLTLSNFVAMADAYKRGELRHSKNEQKGFGGVASVSYSVNFNPNEDLDENVEDD